MTDTMKTSFKKTLRRFIAGLPYGEAALRLYRYIKEYHRLAKIGNAEDIFNHHYLVNEWGGLESVSGEGSTIKYTENIRREIPRLVTELGVRVILDAPCGDYNWLRMIVWDKEVNYIGGDIVKSLIDRNQSLYGNHNTRFINCDIVRDMLPKADLWLCRDCLFHLSNRDIMLAIDNFLKSDINYILTSTHPNCGLNQDIPTGSFRLLNLQMPPFNFGKPLTLIDDWIEGFPVRQLALWERESLRTILYINKVFRRLTKKDPWNKIIFPKQRVSEY